MVFVRRSSAEPPGPCGRSVPRSRPTIPFEAPNPGRSARTLPAPRRGDSPRRRPIGELARLADRDELAVAALLHDVGRRVLAELYGDFELDAPEATPDERVRRERRELGIDHALVGAVLVRRWGCRRASRSRSSATTRRRRRGAAAAIRLADLVVHYASGEPAPAGGDDRRRRRSSGSSASGWRRCSTSSPTRARRAARLGPVPAFRPRGRRAPGSRRGQGVQADRPASCRSR